MSPLIQDFLNIQDIIKFPGESQVLWGFFSAVFLHGSFPFLKGIFTELKSKSPGMMTFIALAITVAYAYSSAVVFGLSYRKHRAEIIAKPSDEIRIEVGDSLIILGQREQLKPMERTTEEQSA